MPRQSLAGWAAPWIVRPAESQRHSVTPLRRVPYDAAAEPCQRVGRRVLPTRTSDSREPSRPAAELDAVKRSAPTLAGQDWKGAGQGAGGDDVTGCERRIDRIAR
jgi:hypothetical protein